MSPRSLVKPLVVVLATVGVILGGQRILFPPGGGYIVKAEFDDSAGLTKNSDVKIGGVAGGKVKELELTDRDTALVTMELDDGAFPIGTGASAASRPVNLLGEKFVDMQAGDLSKPLPSGSFIPRSRTSRPVELDDVLNMLDPDVRARLRILINEAGIGMSGRKADFNKILEELPPALDRTGELVRQFSEDERTLGRLIEQSDRVVASMAREDEGLGRLVEAAQETFQTTVARRRELADTVRAAPGTLRQLRTTLTNLSGTAARLEPAATQLRAAAPHLTATLRELPGFARDAGPALTEIERTSPALARLGREGRPTIRRLRPTSVALERFARDFGQVAKSFDEHAMQGLLGLMNGWSRTIRRSDGLGHVFGLRIEVGQRQLQHVIDRYVTPNTKAKRRKERTERPAATEPVTTDVPKAVDRVRKGLEDVKRTLDGATKPVQEVVGGVTKGLQDVSRGITDGLRRKEQDQQRGRSDAKRLLDYLVGG
ncbi:MAG TPA: MlaD family protein [Baekduia sp.]|nr:MlaD family protein [Baekduia sp.]